MDIMAFGQAHLLYFRLQAKLGLYYDDRRKSSTFLRSVQHTEFVDVCTILQTHIETFLDPYEEGYLPPHLCLMGLAQRIDKNRQSRVRGDLLPRARRMQGLSWMTVIRFVIILFLGGHRCIRCCATVGFGSEYGCRSMRMVGVARPR